MNKSSRLLHLDPWKTAMARREAAKAESLSDAKPETLGGQIPQSLSAQAPSNLVRPDAQEEIKTVRPDAQTAPNSGAQLHETMGTQSASILDAPAPPLSAQTPKKKRNLSAQTPSAEDLGAQIRNRLGVQKLRDRADGRVRHHIRLSEANSQRFVDFCLERKISMQDFLELAGAHFLECLGAQKLLNLDAQTPHDDLKIFKTREDIIMLYQELTGNPWKVRDDVSAQKYNEVDRRYVEIGMLTTLVNTKQPKISSFNYFLDEIEKTLEVRLGDETLNAYVATRRKWWEAKKRGEIKK